MSVIKNMYRLNFGFLKMMRDLFTLVSPEIEKIHFGFSGGWKQSNKVLSFSYYIYTCNKDLSVSW